METINKFVSDEINSSSDEQNQKISLLLGDLASLENYISALFTFFPLPICFVSPLGVILESNPAFEKISNLNADELIGKPIEELFERGGIEDLAKDALEKAMVSRKEILFFPKRKNIELTVQAFARRREDEAGKTIGYFLGLFDLTQIKQTEKELKEAQNALLNILEDTEEARGQAEEERDTTETIIANFTDGLLVFNSLGRLSLINPQAMVFLKIKEKDIVGKTIQELHQLPNFKPLAEVIERRAVREEVPLKEDLVLEVSAVPTVEKTGVPVMLLVVLHDITEEKEFEEMKTDFASLAAHELRTPISAIKGYLAPMIEGKTGVLNEEQKLYAERAFTANERQLQIVESLLEISKIEKGRVELKPTEFSIVELAQESARGYAKKAMDKGLTLEVVEPKEDIQKLLLDRERIREVLDNLLSNAVKFTPKGSVAISFERRGQEVVVTVADTGVGIPKNKMGKLFTKFYRVGQTPTIESEGTGLGLYIAKSLVELHQGKIWVESKVGKGSAFYFSLPFEK